MVLIDPEYVKDRKVFGHVLAAFRYGREDLDVLGLTFRKDLYLAAEQVIGKHELVQYLIKILYLLRDIYPLNFDHDQIVGIHKKLVSTTLLHNIMRAFPKIDLGC